MVKKNDGNIIFRSKKSRQGESGYGLKSGLRLDDLDIARSKELPRPPKKKIKKKSLAEKKPKKACRKLAWQKGSWILYQLSRTRVGVTK